MTAILDRGHNASSQLLRQLASFCREEQLGRSSRIVVGFSAGNDSSALLWGLAKLARRHGFLVLAAHLDHGLTDDSAARARQAARLATALGVRCQTRRHDIRSSRRRGESLEAAARRVRYGFLEEVRRGARADLVATAHHRDDQLETLLIRLLQGTELRGLAGIRGRHGYLARPLLEWSRGALEKVVAEQSLQIVDDPSNRDTRFLRNLVRSQLVPCLDDPAGLAATAQSLAQTTERARQVLDRRLAQHLDLRTRPGLTSLDRESFERLPAPLRPWALALLHERAGATYPPRKSARKELLRQFRASGAAIGCDCCSRWRWEANSYRLRLRPKAPKNATFPVYLVDSD